MTESFKRDFLLGTRVLKQLCPLPRVEEIRSQLSGKGHVGVSCLVVLSHELSVGWLLLTCKCKKKKRTFKRDGTEMTYVTRIFFSYSITIDQNNVEMISIAFTLFVSRRGSL